jgi:phage terminase large subunit
MPLTTAEEIELLNLLEQEDREKVAPKFEAWREPHSYKAACGGRGAGAKSRSVSSLLVQRLEAESLRWFCGRQIQKTLEESSYSLILDQIDRLQYKGWVAIPSRSRIENTKNGSYFYFAGVKDEKTAKGMKGLEDYDGAWFDEAEDFPMDIWDIIIPSFRKNTSEIWVTFNRNKESDPAYKLFFTSKPPDTISMFLKPGKEDNPWFPDKLQAKMEHDYRTRPAIAEHIWGGQPKQQGFNSVMSRVKIRQAMSRSVQPIGKKVCGVDVARFGDDDSVMYLRHGQKVLKYEVYNGLDTQILASKIWEFIGRNPTIRIVIDDTGVGGGVTDRLRKLGAKVTPVNFGAGAIHKDKYADIITEMWFEFDPDEADIPDDPELMDELTERLYDYDKNEIKKVEPKKEFKKRYGKSPDKADALLLCFFPTHGMEISKKGREGMAARRRRVA